MWAPWVVLTVFLVVLAFTHWFLQPPRPAEMGRLFVGTLTLLCSLLMTVMVTLLTPLSLPTDIQQQTIYTVVSKPVRRIELIWGRMLGFMAIVTVLVLVFGGISLFYLWRTVGGTIRATDELAAKEARAGRPTQANHLREQAEQLRTRMAAASADQGVADLPRLARQLPPARDRRRPGAVDARAEEPHRGGHRRHRDLELRACPRPV